MSDQLALGLADRHTGQARNLAHAAKSYRDDRARVETAVADLARTGDPFTADDVHRAVQEASSDPYAANTVSSVLGIWSAQQRIVEVRDRRPALSTRRTRHASRNRWWRGNTTAAPSPRTGN